MAAPIRIRWVSVFRPVLDCVDILGHILSYLIAPNQIMKLCRVHSSFNEALALVDVVKVLQEDLYVNSPVKGRSVLLELSSTKDSIAQTPSWAMWGLKIAALVMLCRLRWLQRQAHDEFVAEQDDVRTHLHDQLLELVTCAELTEQMLREGCSYSVNRITALRLQDPTAVEAALEAHKQRLVRDLNLSDLKNIATLNAQESIVLRRFLRFVKGGGEELSVKEKDVLFEVRSLLLAEPQPPFKHPIDQYTCIDLKEKSDMLRGHSPPGYEYITNFYRSSPWSTKKPEDADTIELRPSMILRRQKRSTMQLLSSWMDTVDVLSAIYHHNAPHEKTLVQYNRFMQPFEDIRRRAGPLRVHLGLADTQIQLEKKSAETLSTDEADARLVIEKQWFTRANEIVASSSPPPTSRRKSSVGRQVVMAPSSPKVRATKASFAREVLRGQYAAASRGRSGKLPKQ